MLTFAQPREIKSVNRASVSPVPPCRTIGIGCSSTSSVTRSGLSSGVRLYSPCAVPIAGANE